MANMGCIIWLTGLSGAGKTTIANELKTILDSEGLPVELLDGDIIRQNLSKDLGFSRADRISNTERIGFVAGLLARHGVVVIVAAISPFRSARDKVRSANENFIEVFVNCSLQECEKRDVKGLYQKVRNGEIKYFTGIDDPYEEPLDPHVTCDTELESPETSAKKIISTFKNYGGI